MYIQLLVVLLEANTQTASDLQDAYWAVSNYTMNTGSQGAIFYVGVSAPPHPSIASSLQNLTTVAFMNIQDMYGTTLSRKSHCVHAVDLNNSSSMWIELYKITR